MTDNEKRIYLDNSASTAVDERVLEKMQPYWREVIGNAGSLHQEGQRAKEAVEHARNIIAEALHTQQNHIVFTSGGTESNNMAVLGVVQKAMAEGREAKDIEVITSSVEHNSVLDCFNALKRIGVRVQQLSNNEEGLVDTEELKSLITEKTVLISIVYVNNEIGTIQDDVAIKRAIREAKQENKTQTPFLHYDASQAPVWLPLDVEKLSVDLLTLDSQKIYGPKGAGCLYIRNLDSIQQILFGGEQEMGFRPGTPPTPLLVGFAEALGLLEEERDSYVERVRDLQTWFVDSVENEIEHVTFNGPQGGERRVAGNVNFSFEGIEGERLVLELDAQGIACSTGSACLIDNKGGSHIIQALNKEQSSPTNTIRFTFHRNITREELQKTLEILTETVKRIRTEH